MKKILVFAISLLILTMPVSAIDSSKFDYDSIKETFNENLADMPWVVKTVAGSERINVNIVSTDGSTKTIGVAMNEGSIETLKDGSIEKPTITLYFQEDEIVGLLEADNPVQYAKEKFGQNGLRIEAHSLAAKIKIFIMSIGLGLLSLITTILGIV